MEEHIKNKKVERLKRDIQRADKKKKVKKIDFVSTSKKS